MTNLIKSYKGQNQVVYPDRNDEDAESSSKWENLVANYTDEGEYFGFFKFKLPYFIITTYNLVIVMLFMSLLYF